MGLFSLLPPLYRWRKKRFRGLGQSDHSYEAGVLLECQLSRCLCENYLHPYKSRNWTHLRLKTEVPGHLQNGTDGPLPFGPVSTSSPGQPRPMSKLQTLSFRVRAGTGLLGFLGSTRHGYKRKYKHTYSLGKQKGSSLSRTQASSWKTC